MSCKPGGYRNRRPSRSQIVSGHCQKWNHYIRRIWIPFEPADKDNRQIYLSKAGIFYGHLINLFNFVLCVAHRAALANVFSGRVCVNVAASPLLGTTFCRTAQKHSRMISGAACMLACVIDRNTPYAAPLEKELLHCDCERNR